MKITDFIEKVFRSRKFWILLLLSAVFIVGVFQSIQVKSIGFLFTCYEVMITPLGIVGTALAISEGTGLKGSLGPNPTLLETAIALVPFAVYPLFWVFIYYVKRLPKKVLIILGVIIILIMLIGIKGGFSPVFRQPW